MSKVFIVTGTRQGIGHDLAAYYLKAGHTVVGCSRGEPSIEHERYRHARLDVSDEAAVVRLVTDVRNTFGTVDVLLNNAGVAGMNHVLTTPAEAVARVFSTNVLGSFLFLREVSKVMVKAKYGRIVNFTSIASPLRLEGEAVYAASKAAIENLTQTAAKELGSFGITVNAVGPSVTPTGLTKTVPKERIDALVGRQAIKRPGRFEDIANIIDFFLSDRSDFVTGQIIYLGGIHD